MLLPECKEQNFNSPSWYSYTKTGFLSSQVSFCLCSIILFRLYFLTQLKRAGVPKQDLALFYVSCVRSVIDYAAPVFFNGLPQYLKKELVRLEKRAVSIITSGKCNSAIEEGLTPILEHYYVLCSRLFDSIVSDPNHKLKVLLPPNYDNLRYNLRRQRHFNMPKLCTNRTSNTFIYAMSKQSEL